MLDITDEAARAAAVRTVAEAVGERGLAGLVNNAGIVKPAPIEFQPLADFREQLEVNLVAHVAVIQSFLPLIRQGHGRIVNVGSIGGRIVLPIHGAYSVSKFGMEALSDALRLELRQWRIPVSLVDPGARTRPSSARPWPRSTASRRPSARPVTGCTPTRSQRSAHWSRRPPRTPAPALVLAKAVGQAMTSDRPKARYLAGRDAKAMAALARTATDHAKDLAIAKEVGLPKPE